MPTPRPFSYPKLGGRRHLPNRPAHAAAFAELLERAAPLDAQPLPVGSRPADIYGLLVEAEALRQHVLTDCTRRRTLERVARLCRRALAALDPSGAAAHSENVIRYTEMADALLRVPMADRSPAWRLELDEARAYLLAVETDPRTEPARREILRDMRRDCESERTRAARADGTATDV